MWVYIWGLDFYSVFYYLFKDRHVAQLGRAVGSHPTGRQFKSGRAYHIVFTTFNSFKLSTVIEGLSSLRTYTLSSPVAVTDTG